MLTAFFDDSGSSLENEIAVVAGYLGITNQWADFCRRWANLLSDYKLSRLHRAELESYQGEFIHWTGELRNEFVQKAQKIIKDCTYCGVGIALVKSDFEEVVAKDARARKFGDDWLVRNRMSCGGISLVPRARSFRTNSICV
jgi:hypothetical protein